MWRAGILALALAACTQFPELDRTIGPEVEAADYPDLIPLEPVMAGMQDAPERNAQIEAEVQSRADALRARADRLRGGVVDSETQARMRRGVPQG